MPPDYRLVLNPSWLSCVQQSNVRQRYPELASVHNTEIHKLEQAGHTVKLTPEQMNSTDESLFTPHHIVYHNYKPRIVSKTAPLVTSKSALMISNFQVQLSALLYLVFCCDSENVLWR